MTKRKRVQISRLMNNQKDKLFKTFICLIINFSDYDRFFGKKCSLYTQPYNYFF